MPLTPESVADHIHGILPRLDKGHFESLGADLQQYPIMDYWLKKMHEELGSGLTVRKNLMQVTAGVARHVGPETTDDVDIPNHGSFIVVPWRRVQTAWAYDFQVDILMNRGAEQIVDLVQMRRLGAKIDLAKELEAKAWNQIAPDNTLDPLGIPNWVVYVATAAPGGFTGTFPTTTPATTSIGGLTDLTQYKNYSSTYTTVSKTDLFKSMRSGHRLTTWHSPATVEQANSDSQRNLRYYAPNSVHLAIEDVGESQNENLGRDLAPYASGKDPDIRRDDLIAGAALTFRRHPLLYVPYLDDTALFPTTIATEPIYGIDHSKFFVYCLSGDYMRETGPKPVPDQHNKFRTFSETSYCYVCLSRRCQQVYSK